MGHAPGYRLLVQTAEHNVYMRVRAGRREEGRPHYRHHGWMCLHSQMPAGGLAASPSHTGAPAHIQVDSL